MTYLIDTNCFAYYFKGWQPVYAEWFKGVKKEDICLSCFVYTELMEGYITKKSQKALEALDLMCQSYHFLNFTKKDAALTANIRSGLRAQSIQIAGYDIPIAAQAINHNLTLVTFNKKDFLQIPGIRLKTFDYI